MAHINSIRDTSGTVSDIAFERDRVLVSGKSGEFPLFGYSLVSYCIDAEYARYQYLQPFTTTGGSSSKQSNSNAKFVIGAPIYYLYSRENFTANTSFEAKEFYTVYEKVDARYINTVERFELGSDKGSAVYICVSVDGNGCWSPLGDNENPLICCPTDLVANNFYIYLGRRSSNVLCFQLEREHPLYHYDGSRLIEWTSYLSQNANYSAGNGIQISSRTISVKLNSNGSNGLSTSSSGLGLNVVTPSTNGVGGSNGAMTAADKEKLDSISYGAGTQVQSDWDETDTTDQAYIKNKPSLDSSLTTSEIDTIWNNAS